MMLATMVSVLAHLLALFVSGLGRDLLPCLVLLLLGLVPSVLLVLVGGRGTFKLRLVTLTGLVP
jgi:hypothetical protein